jgi:hypothetical protein
MRLAFVVIFAVSLSGCMVHVAEDSASHRDGEATACSVSCSTVGKASASCRLDQVPSCGCQPAPVAVCVSSGASYL